MKPLRIALTKGRLEKTTIELFQKIGYNCDEVINKGRRLILPIGDNDFEVVLAKAADVITYVEHGVKSVTEAIDKIEGASAKVNLKKEEAVVSYDREIDDDERSIKVN